MFQECYFSEEIQKVCCRDRKEKAVEFPKNLKLKLLWYVQPLKLKPLFQSLLIGRFKKESAGMSWHYFWYSNVAGT